MEMKEIVNQISFLLGLPSNENVEDLQIEQAVEIAFKELKRYMRTSTEKTVPYSTLIDLVLPKANFILAVESLIR